MDAGEDEDGGTMAKEYEEEVERVKTEMRGIENGQVNVVVLHHSDTR